MIAPGAILALTLFVVLIDLYLGALHIYWGHGGNWPGKDRQALIDRVFGEGNRFPSIFACYAVALLLTAVAGLALASVYVQMQPQIKPLLYWANISVSSVFFIRGAGGYLPVLEKRWTAIFVRYNRRIYNPLCLSLAGAYAFFAAMH